MYFYETWITDAPCHSQYHCSQIWLYVIGVCVTPLTKHGWKLAYVWSVVPSSNTVQLVCNFETGREFSWKKMWCGQSGKKQRVQVRGHHHILSYQNFTHCMAVLFASLRSSSEQWGPSWHSWRMCFIVWIAPQRQSGSVSSPHLWRFSFVFPASDLALFKVTQFFLPGFEPGGSFSSGFGRAPFCCLPSYSRQGSNLYEAAWLGLISCTVTKFLRDLSLRLTSWCPYSECLGSFSCLCRSIFVTVSRPICGGGIPLIR